MVLLGLIMDGILNINKPWGRTSFSVVAMVRRLTGERRIGHAGTLDPAATGVLPVCLGQGTRIVEFLMDATKTYRAEIELGVETDTYDASGRVTMKRDVSKISLEKVGEALRAFRGLIQQTPPMYSAVKYQGKPLYKLARAGIKVERKSRPARIEHIELTGWQPPVATIEVVCGKGTYIRSLAHDLGQALGCGASLRSLVRLRCGLFHIDSAVSVHQLEDAVHCGYWQHYLHPIDSVLSHWKAVIVSDDGVQAIRNGSPLVLADGNDGSHVPTGLASENLCRAYTPDGYLLGVLRFNLERGQWQPEKVFL
jgi:tRNA pseudouridine55 synthase